MSVESVSIASSAASTNAGNASSKGSGSSLSDFFDALLASVGQFENTNNINAATNHSTGANVSVHTNTNNNDQASLNIRQNDTSSSNTAASNSQQSTNANGDSAAKNNPTNDFTAPPSKTASGTAVAVSDSQSVENLMIRQRLLSTLSKKLSDLDKALSSLIQQLSASASLTGSVTPAVATPIGTPISGGTAGNDLSAILSQLLASLQNGTAGATQPVSASGTQAGADASSFLQNLQSILGQLQQAEGSISSFQSTTAASSGSAQNDALQSVLANLTTLLGQQTPANSTTTPKTVAMATALPTATDATSSASTASAVQDSSTASLKSTIADIQKQLQALNDVNRANFSQAQASLQSSTTDTLAFLNNALVVNGLTVKENAVQGSVSYAGVAASQTQGITTVQASGNTQNDILFAINTALVQQASGSSTNSDSGNNGQGQPQAFDITLVSATQSQSNSDVNGTNFSQALQQQSAKPLLDQVAFQVKTAIGDGSSKISIQLHPADLGKLDIKLEVGADGKTNVVVTADNHKTLELLQRDAQGLSKMLNDAGLKTDSGSLSFNLGGGGQNQNNSAGKNAQPIATYQQIQPENEPDLHLAIISQSYVMNVAEGLDIKI